MKSGPVFILSVFGFFWSAITLLFDCLIGRDIAGEWRSRSFAETTGHVQSSKVTRSYGSKSINYSADILYNYRVNGQTFTGKKVRYGTSLSSSRISAEGAVAGHPAETTTPVYFDPSNPSDAVLEIGLTGPSCFTTIFLAPFNVIMLGLWLAIIDTATNSKGNRIAGGVCLLEDEMRTRAQMPRFTAPAAGLLTLAGTSFLAIFIVGFGTKMNPSLAGVAVTWCGILAVSAGVFARRWWRIHSGAEDLVIDPGARVLTLPRTFGRKESMLVPFNDVKALFIQRVEHRSSKTGVSYTWAPAVQFQDGRKPEKLADWGSQERAAAFAQWLREKTGLPVKS